ncbi:hypothetical protein GJ496_000012 [Pomphorhynchus laevis]|nr:hypothetical protein GJ496_000012 [Pomphorhynchus laevis]
MHVTIRRSICNALISAFDSHKSRINPKGIFNLKQPDLKLLTDQCMSKSSIISETIRKSNTAVTLQTTLQHFDDLSDCICKAADLMEFLRHCGPLKLEAAIQHSRLNRLVNELNTDQQLYSKLVHANKCKDLSGTDKLLCRSLLTDFQQSGIHLEQGGRDKFIQLQDKLNVAIVKIHEWMSLD